VDDTELIEGLVFTQHASHAAGGPSRVTNAKIGLIQFQLSSPKTNVLFSLRFSHLHDTDGE
jgi:T-complex protein 1 subunit delta